MKPTRREVLAGATAMAVAPGCIKEAETVDSGSPSDGPAPLRSPEPDSLWDPGGDIDLSRFPSGLQVGDVGPNSALVSLHSTTDGITIHLAQGQTDDWVAMEDHIAIEVQDSRGRTTLEGLKPDTAYCVVATDGDVRSTVSRFRTALDSDGWRVLTIGATSCLYANQPWRNMSHVAAERPDMFCFLGDTVYADSAQTLEQYRSHWRRALTTQGLLDVSQNTSMIATWDDHEVVNDFEGRNASPDRVAAALQAFREAMPQRAGPNGESLWRKLSWGATADVFVLDSRGERDGDSEYLSRTQMDWLKSELSASSARFKIIMNSVPITDYSDVFGPFLERDRWTGYPDQRTEILGHIEVEAIEGVLWLTGDFHCCSAARIGLAGELGDGMWEVMVGPGGSMLNIAATYMEPTEQFPVIFAEWTSSLLTLDPGLGTATIQWVGDAGDVLASIDITL